MKKLSLTALLLLLGASAWGVEFRVPRDVNGYPVPNVSEVGVDVLTGTDTYVSGSTIAVYGVLTGTAPIGTITLGGPYVELRSTHAAVVAFASNVVITAVTNIGELLMPRIYFTTETANTYVWFNPPVLSPGGVHMTVSSHGALATLFYRHVSTNVNELFVIPRDADGTPGSMSFYGLTSSSETAPGQIAGNVHGAEALDGVTAEKLIGFGTNTVTGPGLFYDIIAGTVAPTTYVVLKDSASVLGDPAHWIVPIFPGSFDPALRDTSYKTAIVSFGFPLKYVNQMNVQTSAAIGNLRIRVRQSRSWK